MSSAAEAAIARLRAADDAEIERIRSTGGDVVVSEATRRKLEAAAAAKAERIGDSAKWLDPNFQRRMAAEHEAAAEAERTAGPPKRKVLRQAHQLRAEAAAAVERLTEASTKAKAFAGNVTARKTGIEAAIVETEKAAADRLVAGFTGLAELETTDDDTKRNTLHASLRQVLAEHDVAEKAAARLAAELAQAQDRLTRCNAGVSRTAVACLVDIAADIANTIITADAELAQRRHDLSMLAQLITLQERRLDGRNSAMPAAVPRAIHGEDRQLIGRRPQNGVDWAAVHRGLCEDPEAYAELDRGRLTETM
jgi:hypothetical protein